MEGQSLSSESLSHLLYYVKNGKVVKEAKQNMVWNYILPSQSIQMWLSEGILTSTMYLGQLSSLKTNSSHLKMDCGNTIISF